VVSSCRATSGAPDKCFACAAASARRATRRIGRQLDRALQESGAAAKASASLRSVGGALELSGDVLVGARHRLRAVPGAAIRIELGIRHLGRRPLHGLTLLGRRRTPDVGAHQRVAEMDRRAELEEPFGLRVLERVVAEADPLGCTPEEREVADRLRSR
jgi:hypothetical protein